MEAKNATSLLYISASRSRCIVPRNPTLRGKENEEWGAEERSGREWTQERRQIKDREKRREEKRRERERERERVN
jgi:hypothetical protein